MEERMLRYRIFRIILGGLYKFWYNPKVYGKENIPTEGPIIIAGNHVHIMDQCNVIIATKRCIHYMAKKEYFDDKRVAWFFKAAHCIPVNRSIHDDSAKESAIEVLKNKQALGIFPEGTRNAIKVERAKEVYEKYFSEELSFEEFYKKVKNNKTTHINYLEELKDSKVITEEEFRDNVYTSDEFLNDMILNYRITKEEYYNHSLLPFKFGAVSMAHKTNAKIVPYAITGEYKFRSKNLVVKIGEPIEVTDDYEESNKRLAEAIKKLMK